MSIEIGALTLDRLEEALTLWTDILGMGIRSAPEGIADLLRRKEGVFLIATDLKNGKIVGLKFGFFEGEACIGRGVAVLPDYRRRGIATDLVRRFESELQAFPNIKLYAFGSGTTEGVPFHIAMGYAAQALVQFEDPALRPSLDISAYSIARDAFSDQHKVYQICINLDVGNANLAGLHSMQAQYPQVSIQFFFQKVTDDMVKLPRNWH